MASYFLDSSAIVKRYLTETGGNPMVQDQKTLEEKLNQLLLDQGLLTQITPPLPPDKVPKDRKPIPLENRAGSRLILEERR